MELVRTHDADGTLFGELADGRWVRWDDVGGRWVAATRPAGAEARPRPRWRTWPGPGDNAVDRWFNRHFPPFSLQRYAFGAVGIVVFAAVRGIVGVLSGRPFRWDTFLFVALAGPVVLAVPFLVDLRRDPDRPSSATPADGGIPSREGRVLSGAPSPFDGTPVAWRRRRPWTNDPRLTFVVAFAGTLAFDLGLGLGAAGFAFSVLGAAAMTFVLHHWRTWWVPAILSGFLGFVGAGVLYVFSSLFGHDTPFVSILVLTTVAAAVFVFPAWWRTRVLLDRHGIEVPATVVAALASGMLLMVAVLASLGTTSG